MKFNKKLAALGLSLIMATSSIIPVMAEDITRQQDWHGGPFVDVYTIKNVTNTKTITIKNDVTWKTGMNDDGTPYIETLMEKGLNVPVYDVKPGTVITTPEIHGYILRGLTENNGNFTVDEYDKNIEDAIKFTHEPYSMEHDLISGTIELKEEGYYYFSAWKYDLAYRLDQMASILHVTDGKTEPEKPVEPTTPAFTDVKATDYFYNAVNWAVENKITAGTSKTTFSPNETCTNAQILTYIWIANGSKEATKEAPFTDVAKDAYYAKAAAWAYENGIVEGDKLNPDGACSRLSTMQFLWKAANKPVIADYKLPFTDVKTEDQQAAAWALQQKITAGTSETTFSPEDTCTRGQIMTFLYNDYAK